MIPSHVIAALEEHPPQTGAVEMFDLFVGTSTGGLIALALAVPTSSGRPLSGKELVSLYRKRGAKIFGPSSVDPRRDPLTALVTAAGGPRAGAAGWVKALRDQLGLDRHSVGNARYSPDSLEQLLRDTFGEAKLGAALRPVLVTCFDLASRVPVRLRGGPGAGADAGLLVSAAARATTAAPTYFPATTLGRPSGVYVDGGLVANNPSAVALTEALRLAAPEQPVVLVSLGTGRPSPGTPQTAAAIAQRSWPLVALDVMDALFEGTSELEHELLTEVAALPQSRLTYLRIQRELGTVSAVMDDASPEHLEELNDHGKEVVAEYAATLAALASTLRGTHR